jgi:hypothetical protein
MRSRKHEIKIRLNDAEFDRLNEMVERSIFSREEFIRMMLAGYTLQEAPKEYIQFKKELSGKLTEIHLQVMQLPISDPVYQEIKRLTAEVGRTLALIGEICIPYYKQRGIEYDKS